MTASLAGGFIDTNILVYAHDTTAGRKRDVARSLLANLWESDDAGLSVQILQELFVSLTRKVPRPLDAATAALLVRDLSCWHVHAPDSTDVLAAVDIHARHGLSFWDAMIVRSAGMLGCAVLLSEDLNPGQIYDGVRVHNPFQ